MPELLEGISTMDIRELDRIKRLAIMAMVTDDELMQVMVLKGGNAIDIVYGMGGRASRDLDFSISIPLVGGSEEMERRIRTNLERIYRENGYHVFDIKVEDRPEHLAHEVEMYWGGYQVCFKIIPEDKKVGFAGNLEQLRRNAIVLGSAQERIFTVDVSNHEYCEGKKDVLLDGYTVYVYTPEMIVFEKLRAICQQMPEYRAIVVSKTANARARDFYDVHLVTEKCGISWSSEESRELVKRIFEVKRVPLFLIGKIGESREFHRPDFEAVVATVKQNIELRDFDFYFDYVVTRCNELKSLWVV